MSSTDQLLETLILSNNNLNNNVGELTKSVNALVTIDAARAEREKYQEEKNKLYDDFISVNEEALSRVRRFHGHWDKMADKVFTMIVISILGLLGFNFLG